MLELMPKDLSPRDIKFADAILLGASAEKAEISAGGSVKSARTLGPRRLRKVAVKEYIAAKQAQTTARVLSRREKIERELELLALSRVEHLIRIDADGLPQVDFSNATPEQLAAVTSVQTKRRTIYNPKGEVVGVEDNAKFSMADKYKGLELLGKLEGMFRDEQTIVVDVADRLLSARSRLLNVTPRGTEDDE